MAVSALGLPFLLQASANQLDTLFAGLNAGDQVRGRVVEMLGQDQAVVSLRGQNVVAQLPPVNDLQKGDLLLLQVTQMPSTEAGRTASLTLRLLPASVAAAGSPGILAQTAPASNALPAQAVVEQALSNARLPVNSLTVTVAETLARLGAPLDAASLQRAVQATEALLTNEAPPTGPQVPLLSPQVQAALQDGLSQVKVAAQFSPSSQANVLLQQAARELTQALEPGSVASSPPVGAAVVPTSTAPLGLPAAASVAPPPGPAPLTVTQALVQVEQAVAQVVAQPTTAAVQALQASLGQLQQAQTAAMTVNVSPTVPLGPASIVPASAAVATTSTGPSAPVQAPSAPSGSNASLSSLPARREAVVQLLALVGAQVEPQTGAVATDQVGAQAQALEQAYSQPASAPSQALVAAVLAQQPEAQPAQILADARQAIQQVVQQLQGPTVPAQLPSAAALRSLLQDAGQAVPQISLSQLPPEHVAEAVAWLQARDLPTQRPLVEAVASWINQDQTALPAIQRVISQVQALPSAVLEARPTLTQALQQVQSALDQSTLHPETQDLAQRLSQWSQSQGMDLEARLGSPAEGPGSPNGASNNVAPAHTAAPDLASGLKPALMRLDGELKSALKDPSTQAPQVARHMEAALHETQAAIQAMNAVPLQAQAAPAFDSVHLPLPVWISGQLGEGKLSVTWRHGRERQLDDTEPVNVAVALNTESLGPVKVLLQVWKGSANARIIGADPAAAQYLAGGADELRQGFAERTPFKLQTLEFAAAEGGPQGPLAGAADAPPAAAGGFDLSA